MLWLIAVPIMVRRMQKGYSPFKPDREHLHHIFQRLGLNNTQTLIVITMISMTFAAAGALSDMLNVPEYIMFSLFVTYFLLYCSFLNYISKKHSNRYNSCGFKFLYRLCENVLWDF